MEWLKDKNRRTGILVTIMAHILLAFLLSFLILEPPFPPPPQFGVEVNLGNSNQGMTDIQPETPNQQASKPAASQPKTERIVTQSTEESVNIKKKTTETRQKPQETQEPVIDDRFTFPTNKNKTGGNQGQTGNPGDQGMETGNPTANNYAGDGGSGGISFELAGRKTRTLIRPDKVPNQEGRVVMKIWVNKEGKVTNAKQEVSRSTTTNSALVSQAEKSALNSVFDANPNAAEVQTGYITYIFTL